MLSVNTCARADGSIFVDENSNTVTRKLLQNTQEGKPHRFSRADISTYKAPEAINRLCRELYRW